MSGAWRWSPLSGSLPMVLARWLETFLTQQFKHVNAISRR